MSNNLNVNSHMIIIYDNNQNVIILIKNSQNYDHCKHIKIQQSFVRKKINDDIVNLIYTLINEMIADNLIKILNKDKFKIFRVVINLEKLIYCNFDTINKVAANIFTEF